MGLKDFDPYVAIGMVIIAAVVFLCYAVIHQEITNPCVERGPREVSRIDPQTGYVHYRRPCVRRQND